MRIRRLLLLFLTVAAPAAAVEAPVSPDLAAALLERFRPRFVVAVDDCSQRPAAFVSRAGRAQPGRADGTIYGRVLAAARPTTRHEAMLELRYYHLWARDCGQLTAHRLDAEYIAGVVAAATLQRPAGEWRARYWYAAAHVGTVCDASNGALACAVAAIDRGPTVWISYGKHASFLSAQLCRSSGCAADDCTDVTPLEVRPIGMLEGTADRRRSRGSWVDDPDWDLRAEPVVTPAVRSRLDAAGCNGPITLAASPRAIQRSIAVGVYSARGIGAGARAADGAVATGIEHSAGALRAVGRALAGDD